MVETGEMYLDGKLSLQLKWSWNEDVAISTTLLLLLAELVSPESVLFT